MEKTSGSSNIITTMKTENNGMTPSLEDQQAILLQKYFALEKQKELNKELSQGNTASPVEQAPLPYPALLAHYQNSLLRAHMVSSQLGSVGLTAAASQMYPSLTETIAMQRLNPSLLLNSDLSSLADRALGQTVNPMAMYAELLGGSVVDRVGAETPEGNKRSHSQSFNLLNHQEYEALKALKRQRQLGRHSCSEPHSLPSDMLLKQQQQQQQNWKTPVSPYRGVSFHRRDKKWTARTWIQGKIVHLGMFVEEKMAALFVDLRKIEEYGDACAKKMNFDTSERIALAKTFAKRMGCPAAVVNYAERFRDVPTGEAAETSKNVTKNEELEEEKVATPAEVLAQNMINLEKQKEHGNSTTQVSASPKTSKPCKA